MLKTLITNDIGSTGAQPCSADFASPNPTGEAAIFKMSSLNGVEPRMSTWSAVYPPPADGPVRHLGNKKGNQDSEHPAPGFNTLSLPPFNTHRTKTQQTDMPVAFAHLHSIKDLCWGR